MPPFEKLTKFHHTNYKLFVTPLFPKEKRRDSLLYSLYLSPPQARDKNTLYHFYLLFFTYPRQKCLIVLHTFVVIIFYGWSNGLNHTTSRKQNSYDHCHRYFSNHSNPFAHTNAVENAHWKLYPPNSPVTSNTSPKK